MIKRILVVEDDEDNNFIISTIFETQNFLVNSLTDGHKVYERIMTFKPDLVILDAHLLGIDGRDICLILKSEEETNHIKVILLSAKYTLKNKHKGFEACDFFIEKPFDIFHLESEVRRLLG